MKNLVENNGFALPGGIDDCNNHGHFPRGGRVVLADHHAARTGARSFCIAAARYGMPSLAGMRSNQLMRAAMPLRDLKDLLKDPRTPQTVRYLRRLYNDPMTNKEWQADQRPVKRNPGRGKHQPGEAVENGRVPG
ncbi:MAG: hypothetical protein MZV70_41250 [Desulfobacterales bacterium]|nr:hypothetical protein [Desulfobacterales bacterium]